MVSFVKAKELYNQGKYQEAYEAYLELGKIFGANVVAFNLQECKKHLNDLNDAAYDNKAEQMESAPISSVNKHFDHVYVVNLDFQIEKRLKICNHLNKHGIQYGLFKAKNGYKPPIQEQFQKYIDRPLGSLVRYPDWNEREVKRGKHYIESAGAMGYIHTYIAILKHAKQKGYKKILILEDDILLSNDFEIEFSKFIKNVGMDWKVLQLGASQYNWNSVNHKQALSCGYYYPRQLDTCGSFAIAFDVSIVDELIYELEFFEAPFDHLPLGAIYEKYLGKCYVCYPNIVMPDVGISYIRGERNQYDHSKKMRWQMDKFSYPLKKLKVGLVVTQKAQLKYFLGFSSKDKAVFDIKLFYVSGNGIRPIHNISFFLESDDEILDSSIETDVNVDILGKMIGAIPITERDILSFVQSELGVDNCESKLIQGLKVNDKSIPNMVSVIIPTYQRKESVIKSVLSVINQNYESKEIIIVDDNVEQEFSDYVRCEIERLQLEHPNIRLLYIKHIKNRNGAAARNTGLFHSRGQYICFLDDDDIYLQGRLEQSIKQFSHIESDKIGGVYCGFLGWNSPKNDLERYSEGDLTKDLLLLNYKAHYLHTNTATYRRSAIMNLMGFDESYRRHQDFEFNLRFFESYKIQAVKEVLVKLKPEPVSNSNILKGLEFINLKIKFLKQFDYRISRFSEEDIKNIYQIHWADVARYCDFDAIATTGYQADFKNAWLFFMQELSKKYHA